MKHITLLLVLTGIPLTMSAQNSEQQQLKRFEERSRQQEATLESDPFVGVTTDGAVEPNVFKVQPTGVSAEPIKNATEAFIATLSDTQREETLFSVDDNEWRSWMNQHFYDRAGMGFEDMTDIQKQAIVTDSKTGNHNQTEAFKDNVILPYEGLPVTELNEEQAEELQALVGLFIGQIKEGHAKLRMSEILDHWDKTYFAWKERPTMTPYFTTVFTAPFCSSSSTTKTQSGSEGSSPIDPQFDSIYMQSSALPTETIMGRTCSDSIVKGITTRLGNFKP